MMKKTLTFLLFITVANCQDLICGECKPDQSSACRYFGFKQLCTGTSGKATLMQLWCPRTCRPSHCPPCIQREIRPRSCVQGKDTSCVDGHDLCPAMKALGYCQHQYWGYFTAKKCELSCGECVPADCRTNLPPQTSRCSRDCVDTLPGCEALADNGLCSTNADVRKNCPLSCNDCTSCAGSAAGSSSQSSFGNRLPTNSIRQSNTVRSTQAVLPTSQPSQILSPLECSRRYIMKTVNLPTEVACLQGHNYYRCLHGVGPLQYDPELTASAKDYAEKLVEMNTQIGSGLYDVFPSQPGIDRPRGVGENRHIGMPLSGRYSIKDAITAWYAEGLNYNYNRMEVNSQTSYFTQLIWKDTTHVGCSVNRMGGVFFSVAHYKVAGNVRGEEINNLQPPTIETCLAKCGNGTCQSNEGPDLCECSKEIANSDIPSCSQRCIISCPRPFNLNSNALWNDSCEGETICLCHDQGDSNRGVIPGAICE